MDFLQATILGLVEGFTEFLPISSTAHLILTAKVIGVDQDAFAKTFEIAIQSGAIFAVIVLYWRKFTDIMSVKKIIAAFIPTAIVGFVLYKIIKAYLIGNIAVVLAALFVGGLVLVCFEYYLNKKKSLLENIGQKDLKSISYKEAAIIGLAQAAAVVPGVSRSAATIVGGLALGMSREAIVEFSFLLAVPTILAATFLDIISSYSQFSADQFGLLSLGFVTAFVTAIVGIKFLLDFVKNRNFVAFGVYRMLLVVIFIAFML